jgi:hypothetical protein
MERWEPKGSLSFAVSQPKQREGLVSSPDFGFYSSVLRRRDVP